MKVFKYDVENAAKLEQVDDAFAVHGYSNFEHVSVKVPVVEKWQGNIEWSVATKATDRYNKELKYDFPVCFCTGRHQAGAESEIYWQWVVLLPRTTK